MKNDVMQPRSRFLRILNFIAKAILCLLLILCALVALIHLPPIQGYTAGRLSKYLSSKIQARVALSKIEFSIFGNVSIVGLDVWDVNNDKIFSVDKVEAISNIFHIVTGDFIFDEIHITGFSGKLTEVDEGLNIQFILDAFRPKEMQTSETGELHLQFKKILLESIFFQYASTVNGIAFTTNLGTFTGEKVEFSFNPNKISADKVFLQNTVVDILSSYHPGTITNIDTSQVNKPPYPDFGTGIGFEIMDIEIQDSNFSFHRGKVTHATKFDPAHLELSKIQLSLSDILIRKDTLAAALRSLSAQMPGFKLSDSGTDIHLNRKRFVLSNLHLASNANELRANASGSYDLDSSNDDSANLEVAALGRINSGDLSYFLSDSLMNYFSHWGIVELGLEGNYAKGNASIQSLNLKTTNSNLHAEGIVHDVENPENVYWQDIIIDASIGSDLERTLAPFLKSIKIPPYIKLQLTSSGRLKKMYVDGKVYTAWGDVKAKGVAAWQRNKAQIHVNIIGEKVNLREFTDLSWLGPIDLSLEAKGIVGRDANVEVKGLVDYMEVLDQPIHTIAFQNLIGKSRATASISIEDPQYRANINSEISFSGPFLITNVVKLNDFHLGRLSKLDSTLSISGDLKSEIKIDQSVVSGYLQGKSILFRNQSNEYSLDTIAFDLTTSPTSSSFQYFTDDSNGNLTANFDFRESPNVIDRWTQNILYNFESPSHQPLNKTFNFNFHLKKPTLFQLVGVDIDDFSSLNVWGKFDEQTQAVFLGAAVGKFNGYGLYLDTLNTDVALVRDSAAGSVDAKNLSYNSVQLGNLNIDMTNAGDTTIASLLLSNDSSARLGLRTRILHSNGEMLVYPDRLFAFGNEYTVDRKNPVYIGKKNVVLNHFLITNNAAQFSLDGDLDAFDLTLSNVDLTNLNNLLSPDSTPINKGVLHAKVSYSADQEIILRANIDSLSLYHSNPLTIEATALSYKNHIPFEFLLSNESNKIALNGEYLRENAEVDGTLQVDVNNLEMFAFLFTGVIDEMKGAIKGEAKITGPIRRPRFDGYLRFLDADFTTSNPELTFNVQDDTVALSNSGLLMKDFRIYDREHNPLSISGHLTSKDYQSYDYDLQLHTDKYTLINDPDSASRRLSGLLVIGSDIKLTGNEKDTNIKANVIIKDTTALVFVGSTDDIKLLSNEGIVDFIDPELLTNSIAAKQSSYFYDSLISSLPDFNLNSTISIEDNARMRIYIDTHSGDFIEASGGANLELGYDRTGNVLLSGTYSVKKGLYSLSFHDLVKKNFNLVPGSSINWSGSPENGDLDIKAINTVRTSSIGLIENEVGENEKSIYKRSLPYEVGINIKGTIENPIVSFSLDLPKDLKVSYPVLANKLERLRQPEFQSELNKQVFAVLVLGGFIPESSGSDINQNVIATTALSNSVNSLLSSQLNRFAGRYIKGVDIDVGIQSYSDYAAPGGKTQTAMDFRVTKRIMDERLSFEIGGDFNVNENQSGANTGDKNFRGDIAIIYDLTGNGNKKLKLFNNETYDIIYQEIRNTGVSLIFIREFDRNKKHKDKDK